VKSFAKALYAFEATKTDEMSVAVGDEIYVETAFSDGWALGSNTTNGTNGIFPADNLDLARAQVEPNVPQRVLSAVPSIPAVYDTGRMASAWLPGQTQSFYANPVVENRNIQSQVLSPTVVMASVNSASDRSTPTAKATSTGSSTSQPPATPPTTSKLHIDASEIVIDRNRRIGEGGFGVVYEGTFKGSIKVAVKTIKGDLDPRTMNAFLKEVGNWEGLVQRNGGFGPLGSWNLAVQ
jgi:hypothetical protein